MPSAGTIGKAVAAHELALEVLSSTELESVLDELVTDEEIRLDALVDDCANVTVLLDVDTILNTDLMMCLVANVAVFLCSPPRGAAPATHQL